jgi:transcriptional regulator with XRE-family HTH domain
MGREKIVDELREVMKEKTLSLESAARLIGCSKASVFRWLNGGVPSKLYARAIRLAIRRIKELDGGNKD